MINDKSPFHSLTPAGRTEGVPLVMNETYLQWHGSRPADRSIAADALLREEPDEEDDEEEHGDDEEDDDGDEGYSE